MADWGFKIAKSGYSINSPLQKLILNSKYPVFKIVDSGTGVLHKPAGQYLVKKTIPHNLGYKPVAFVFGNYVDQVYGTVVNKYRFFSFSDTPGLHLFDYYSFWVDNNNLYIQYSTGYWINYDISLNYMYFIFYEETL